MLNFKAGALRPATDGTRAKTIAAANDLVRRTLAQHGLWTDAGAIGAPQSQPGAMDGLPNLMGSLPGLADGMNRLPSARTSLRPAPRIALREGASFETGTHVGISGSRDYRLYVPASASDGVAGIVLMLHGCTQSPEDFATGTGMNALAETHRLVIIYAAQARGANAQSCWNWFSKGDQRRDRGEPEILAGMTRKAMAEHAVPPERVFVAGLSAGAAMAVILGDAYPDIFAAVGAHSGLPFGAARDVPSAFAAMGGDLQLAASATPPKLAVRTIVFHGTRDTTVNPVNSAEIARRASTGVQGIEATETGMQGGRNFQRIMFHDAKGQVRTEHWVIDGLGHAWSGGNSAGSYADPAGPDASAEMVRFFLSTLVKGADQPQQG